MRSCVLCTNRILNRFIDCPVRFQANRLKNFFPSEWYRDHQIIDVKADLLKVAGLPGWNSSGRSTSRRP